MHSSRPSPRVRHGREGLALALLVAAALVGCFRDPKVDVTQPRRCVDSNSCPYGYVCGPDGFCCASSDGKTCTLPPVSTGGVGAQLDGSSGNDALADMPRVEIDAGTGGAGVSAEVGTGTGGAPGSGGAVDGRGMGGGAGGTDRDGSPDSPIGGAGGGPGGAVSGGALGGGGINGSGGVTSPGGTVGSGGLALTGGARASGGATGTGATGGGGIGSGGTKSGGTGSGGTGSGGIGSGGTGSGGTGSGGQTGCGGSQKPCNGGCIPTAECCGGCSGDTPVCDNGQCVGKPNGSTCTTATATQCATGICADNVCCNVQCDGVCEACNLSPAGTCSPSNTPRAGHACNTDGSSCGGRCDGTEGHRKDCYYAPTTTQCAAAMCDSSANKDYNARFCSGDGSCSPATSTHDCGAYGCGTSNQCATGCPNSNQGVCGGACVDIQSSPTHCGTGCTNCQSTPGRPICVAGACVQCGSSTNCSGDTPLCDPSTHTCVGCLSSDPDCTTRTDKKHVCYHNACVECTGNADCSSYTDTPVCYGTTCVECTQPSNCTSRFGHYASCGDNHRCGCRTPSSTNLLAQNNGTSTPGFDGSMGLWSDNTSECGICTAPIADYDSTRDADSPRCTLSGSGHINYYAFFLGNISRCVTASPNKTYYLGYSYMIAPLDPTVLDPESTFMDCQADAYQGSSCSGSSLATLTVPVLVKQLYGTFATTSLGNYFNSPVTTGSIKVSCNLRNIGQVWVDWVYLNTNDEF